MTQLSESRAAELRSVLATACQEANLDAEGAALIKYTNNVVWRLREPVVVRIGVGALGLARAPRVVTLTRWLTERSAPVPRLLSVPQPIVAGEYAATFWEWLPGADDQWTTTDLAVALHRLHALEVPANSDLPQWDPFAAARRRLAAADPILPGDDLAWIRDQWARTEDDYHQLPGLARGIIHGDPHTGNMLRGTDGRAVLCDLDSAGIGPPAWDLATCAVDALRFGRGSDYTQLAAAYGHDVTNDPAWPVLRRIRELGLVTSVLPDLARRPAVAAEHARRLHILRTSDTTTVWRPYR